MLFAWLATGLALLLVLVSPLGDPYSEARPQRFMVFHTRRTLHAAAAGWGQPEGAGDAAGDIVDNFYWVPQLDANTPHSVDKYGISWCP